MPSKTDLDPLSTKSVSSPPTSSFPQKSPDPPSSDLSLTPKSSLEQKTKSDKHSDSFVSHSLRSHSHVNRDDTYRYNSISIELHEKIIRWISILYGINLLILFLVFVVVYWLK